MPGKITFSPLKLSWNNIMKQYGEMFLKTVQTMKTRVEKMKKEKENNASFKGFFFFFFWVLIYDVGSW